MPRSAVLLDVGPAVHQGAGLARYAEQLASYLLAEQSDRVALTLFHNAHSGHLLPPALRSAPQASLPLGQYAWRLSVLASQLTRLPYRPLAHLLRTLAQDTSRPSPPAPRPSPLYHATEHLLPRLPGPTVLTVHDLIFERYPAHHTRLNTLFLRTGMPLFVRAATAIVAVSAHTKRDLVELYRAPAEKIHVIYEGVDDRFRPAPPAEVERVRRQYSPQHPYLLMVGTLEPRKNHAAALRALARLKAAGFPHRLLVVGGQGWLFAPIQALVEQLGLHEEVTFTGYAPAADLPALYSGAAAVLLPSLYEGFGFPVLEAMACAAPVVCSDVSSLPEVAGGAALLVPPENDALLAAAVQLLLTQPGLAADLRARGPQQAARFTWPRCAAQTADLYQAVVEQARPSRPAAA